MKALVHNTRICQIVEDGATFPVHDGLQWVDVADGTVVDRDTYVDNKVVKYVARVPDWKENRVNNYPNIGDQLDDLYHKGAFSDDMAAQIKAVKDKYPKE
tara:strand:- start:186 stop:485 length:300 start_codon:yes stop_codon:yes gene_type:complete